MNTAKKTACIDLGSNSCRLRIADKNGNVIYKDAKATMLGEGLFETKNLTPDAIERGLAVLGEYALQMKNNNVEKYRAVTTAACRMAQNGKDFVRLVKEKTGLDLEIIDTVEEARLNLKGAMLNAPKDKKYVVVYDLGGASTEISLAENSAKTHILYTISIPWGARNSAEAYDLKEFKKANALRLEKDIKEYVSLFCKNAHLEEYRKGCCLIATSSTPLRLCSMIKEDGYYAREKNDGVRLSCESLDEAVKTVKSMSLEERSQSAYIGKDRGPIFIAACIIFKAIYDELKFDEIIVSFKGAQDALLEELKNG